MRSLLLLLFFTFSLYGLTAYEEAYALYKEKKYEEALQRFKTLALQENDYDAAYILGYMYEHGEGCQVDIVASQKFYKESAKGYYFLNKPNPNHLSQKESRKLLKTIDKSMDKETQETIKQYAQSMYNIKAHGANYFLPVSYRFNDVYPSTNGHTAKAIETEFQFSIKYDFATSLLGLDEIYSFAYTQKSFWQLYEESAYFRETNYNPEAFVTIPMGEWNYLSALKALRFSFEHQSNGRGGAEERSWNYSVATLYFQTGPLFTELQVWKDVGSLEYNLDLMEYMGYGQVKFILPYKKHLLKVAFRDPFSRTRGSELNYTYPMNKSNDLFFYLKAFSGYGESLIDYDNRVEKIGIGFSISR